MNYENKITYKLFADEPEVTLVEVDPTDDLIPIGNFLQDCIYNCFTDYDGYGYFVKRIDGKYYAITEVTFSIDEDAVYYKGEFVCGIFGFCNALIISKVIWFNK